MDERRKMMQWFADWCEGAFELSTNNVLVLGKRK
jgi:hypothetical protein